MQTSLNITSVDANNKKVTKSLTYVNPNATNAQLETAAQKFNAISQNTYTDADRIIKMSVTEPYTPAKTEPTLTIGEFSFVTQGFDAYSGFEAAITYDGDGTLSVIANKMSTVYTKDQQTTLYVKGGASSETFSGTLFASEGTNYAAKSINFTKDNT